MRLSEPSGRADAPPNIHPDARCESTGLGPRSRIGAFSFVASGAVVGSGATIAGGAHVLNGATIGPDATVGENAVVCSGVAVARGAVVEPGSVVATPVPANAIVRGNPAVIVGYVAGDLAGADSAPPSGHVTLARPPRVRGASVHRLTRADDLRGSLMAAEFSHLPFVPQRLFSVSGVPSEHIRGSHAHRECAQLLICAHGSLQVVLDDGYHRDEFLLESSEFGLHVPPLTWSTQYKYSADATLLVLASHPYDAGDYIRDYDDFLRLVHPDAAASR